MKHFVIETEVDGSAADVFRHFDRELLELLLPKQPPVKIKLYQGQEVGNQVSVSLWTPFGWTEWTVHITEAGEDDDGFYFVDEGLDLPFFLKEWRHEHRVNRLEEGALIIDKVSFTVSRWVPEDLVLRKLKQQMTSRRSVYKKYFANK